MTDKIRLDPKTSALLDMDFQTAIVDGYAEDKQALLARTASVIEAARKVGMKVIYVVVRLRPGYPEVSARNLAFGAIRDTRWSGFSSRPPLIGTCTVNAIV